MARVQRFDLGSLRKPVKTAQGFLRVDGYASRVGILEYRNHQTGGVRRELRLHEDVMSPASLAGFEGAPITEDHPSEMVSPGNAVQVQRGTVLSAAHQDGDHVAVSFIVTDAKLIKQMESGVKRQLSVGYNVDLDETPGEHPTYGRYDAIQRNIEVNHLAVLSAGRAGPSASVRMDAASEIGERADNYGTPDTVDPDADAQAARTEMKDFGQVVYASSAARRAAYDELLARASKLGLDTADFQTRWCDRLDGVHLDNVLTAAERDKLKGTKFAAPDEGLPIENPAHVQDAMSRFGQEDFPSAEAKKAGYHKILAAAKHFGIDTADFEDKWGDRLDHECAVEDLRREIHADGSPDQPRESDGKWGAGGPGGGDAKPSGGKMSPADHMAAANDAMHKSADHVAKAKALAGTGKTDSDGKSAADHFRASAALLKDAQKHVKAAGKSRGDHDAPCKDPKCSDPACVLARTVPHSDHSNARKELPVTPEELKAALDAATKRADEAEAKLTDAQAKADKRKLDRDDARARNDALTVELSTTRGKLDAATAQLAAADKVRTDSAAALPGLVAARVKLETVASAILGAADKDGNIIDRSAIPDRALKCEVVKHVDAFDIAEGEDESYVKARFDSVVERSAAAIASAASLRASIAGAPVNGVAPVLGRADGAEGSEAKAQQNLRDQYANAWTKSTTTTKKDE